MTRMTKYHPSGRLYTEAEARARAMASCPRMFYPGYLPAVLDRVQQATVQPHVTVPSKLSKAARKKLKQKARR